MSGEKTLRSVFAAPTKKQFTNAFPKQQQQRSTVSAPAAPAAKSTARDGATTKCCSISNCGDESFAVSGAFSVAVLQPDAKPLCITSTPGCAPRQRPVESSVCIYQASDVEGGDKTKLLGGLYPLFCVDDVDSDLICVTSVDFTIVYQGQNLLPNSTVLGSIVLQLVSDQNEPYLSIKVANLTDLQLLVGESGVSNIFNGVVTKPCAVPLSEEGKTFNTAVYRLNLATSFGGGWVVPPKDVFVVDYSFANPPASEIVSIAVTARGTKQQPNCGIEPGKTGDIGQYVVNAMVNKPGVDNTNVVTFCLENCFGSEILATPVIVVVETADGPPTVINASQPILPIVGTNCYETSFNLDPTRLWTLTVTSNIGGLLYKSLPFAIVIIPS